MDIKKIMKEIESSSWLTEEAPGHLGLCLYFMDSFTRWNEFVPFPYLSKNFLLFEGGKMREETLEDEKNKLFLWMIEKTKKDSRFVERLLKKQRLFAKKLEILFMEINKTKLDGTTNKRIFDIYNRMYEIYVPFITVASIPEIGDCFVEYYVAPMLKYKERVDEKEINEVMIMFSTPTICSFMNQEHIDFLRLCISYLSKSKNFKKRLKRHAQKYFWIRDNFAGTYYLDENYFMGKINDEIKGKKEKDIRKEIANLKKEKTRFRKRREEFSRKYRLSDDLRKTFEIYKTFGIMIDERKRMMLIANHYVAKILNEIGARYGLGWQEISNYDFQEIKGLLLDGRLVPKQKLQGRFECSVYMTTIDEGNLLITGNEARQIIGAFDSKIKRDIVKGIVANRADGNITGEVCIIIDPHKERFPEGKIIVTTMTRPDFLPLIKKAKAIITDEGGITCHAAIVSREFGIPCIIGTKNGTRMLKTGDKVEVDTEKGIVRIIN